MKTAQTRLQREADFHDERFAENTRASTDPFYWVGRRAYDRYNELVMENADGMTVLEYGCGPGADALSLAAKGAQVHGIDISPATIGNARAKAAERDLGSKCSFHVMDAEAMTFPDATFDRICGSGILHHLNLSRAFEEIHRTLKPGGKAMFIEPLGHNPIINWYRSRTPEMRTSDEHPLLARDIREASRRFRVATEFYHLLVLGAAYLRHESLAYGIARNALDRIDRVLLSLRSPLRWTAWVVVLVLQKGSD